MANTSAMWQEAKYLPTIIFCSTERAIQKAYLLTNNTGECLRRENVKRRGLQQKKDKTERVTGLDRKMKEDIGKGNPK